MLLLRFCFIVFYLRFNILLSYDYTLLFKGIIILMCWYRIITQYLLLHKFGYWNRYREGKNGIETSLAFSKLNSSVTLVLVLLQCEASSEIVWLWHWLNPSRKDCSQHLKCHPAAFVSIHVINKCKAACSTSSCASCHNVASIMFYSRGGMHSIMGCSFSLSHSSRGLSASHQSTTSCSRTLSFFR